MSDIRVPAAVEREAVEAVASLLWQQDVEARGDNPGWHPWAVAGSLQVKYRARAREVLAVLRDLPQDAPVCGTCGRPEAGQKVVHIHAGGFRCYDPCWRDALEEAFAKDLRDRS